MEFLQVSAAGIPAFLMYFVTSLVLLAAFVAIYVAITPYKEFALIRSGNVAAAASLSGSTLGFAIPLAKAVAQSANLADMAIWAGVALVVQLLVFFAVTRIIPHIGRDIPEGHLAQGIFLGALSLATGILNAACMTY